jgi:hypothetical protein
MNEHQLFTPEEEEILLYGSERDVLAKREMLVADTIATHPKRRGELRAEYERRILRLAREGK